MHPAQINSFDSLLNYLTNFTTWDGAEHAYDEGAAILALGSLLDNLKRNHVETATVNRYLNSEQIAALKLMGVELTALPPDD